MLSELDALACLLVKIIISQNMYALLVLRNDVSCNQYIMMGHDVPLKLSRQLIFFLLKISPLVAY